MSHTSTINSIAITDQAALRSAIIELKQRGVNCELLENATPRAYYDTQDGMGQAPLVMKLNDSPYDVGFYPRADGQEGFEARTDFFSGHVERVLGAPAGEGENREQAKMGKLYQMYAVHAATNKAVMQGYSVSRNEKADGTIQLQVTV